MMPPMVFARLALAAAFVCTLPFALLAPVCADERPAYRLDRDDEDWTFLRDPSLRTDRFDGLKYVPMRANDPNAYASFGFDARALYEHYFNEDWRSSAGSDGYLSQRYLLSADAHLDRFRLYTEIESAFETGRKGGAGPNLQDALDPVAGYVAYAVGGSSGLPAPPLVLEAGRFELDYGGGRMLSANNGPGIRHSFDGVRAIARTGTWRTDAFAAYGVTDRPGAFDDGSTTTQSLIGAYTQRMSSGPAIFEAYALNEHRANVAYQRGRAAESRDTLGMRLGETWGRVDTELEAAYQFGAFGNAGISAYTVAGTAGYTFAGRAAVTRVYLAGGMGSGDHGGRVLGTFRPPTFRAAYLGALAANGPENSVGVQIGVSSLVYRRVNASVEYSSFRRASRSDGVYGVAFNLIAAGAPYEPAAIGSSPLLGLGYVFDRHLSLQTSYQRYGAGAFLTSMRNNATTAYFAAALEEKI